MLHPKVSVNTAKPLQAVDKDLLGQNVLLMSIINSCVGAHLFATGINSTQLSASAIS